MTETIWKIIVDAIKSLINSPPWLLENANLTFDEVFVSGGVKTDENRRFENPIGQTA